MDQNLNLHNEEIEKISRLLYMILCWIMIKMQYAENEN